MRNQGIMGVVIAVVMSFTLNGCESGQQTGGKKPSDLIIGQGVIVDVDRQQLFNEAPELRAGRRIFDLSERRLGEPGDTIYSGGSKNSVVLMGMTTGFVVTSPIAMTRTIWNGQLHEGKIQLGTGNLEGSVEFVNGGELYVEAHSVTATPPAHAMTSLQFGEPCLQSYSAGGKPSGGGTSSPYAFPIVVTTSGGVGAGSVGTAWFCWCKEGILSEDEYWFALLDNPPSSATGTLYVAKGACWGGTGPKCVRKELTSTDLCIRVRGTEISDPMPISSSLREKIDESKARAVAAGLRSPSSP